MLGGRRSPDKSCRFAGDSTPLNPLRTGFHRGPRTAARIITHEVGLFCSLPAARCSLLLHCEYSV